MIGSLNSNLLESKPHMCKQFTFSAFLLLLATPVIAQQPPIMPGGAAVQPPPIAVPVAPNPQPKISLPPVPPVPLINAKSGPAGPVDEVLHRLSSKLTGPITDPVIEEQEFNRSMNLSKQVGQVLRPVGYQEINGKRVMYVQDDTQRIQKLVEGSQVGAIKVLKVSRSGISYSASGKTLFATLAIQTVEPPKAPASNNNGNNTAPQPGR